MQYCMIKMNFFVLLFETKSRYVALTGRSKVCEKLGSFLPTSETNAHKDIPENIREQTREVCKNKALAVSKDRNAIISSIWLEPVGSKQNRLAVWPAMLVILKQWFSIFLMLQCLLC